MFPKTWNHLLFTNLRQLDICIIYHRRKIRKFTFRQYGQLKSRPEKSSQKKEDQHASKVTRKKIHARQMLGKSQIAVFFQWFVALDVPPQVRTRFLKLRCQKMARGFGAKTHFQVKMHKTPQLRIIFWSCDVEKWRAAVARSAFVSQNVQNTVRSAYFLKFRWRRMARCSCANTFKSKSTNTCVLPHVWTSQSGKGVWQKR